jgi:hypothetical protein
MQNPLILLLCSTLLLNSCVTGFTGAAPNKNIVRSRKVIMARQLFGDGKKDGGVFEERYAQAQSDSGARDQLVGELLLLTDLYYEDYKESLYSFTSGTDFLGNATITAMNAVSTVAGGKEFKTLIAALTTGVSGVKSEYNRSILRDKTLQAIFKQMDASRAQVNTNIQRSLKATRGNSSLSDYPITEALRDVVAYYNAGTMAGALTAIEANASAAEQKAKDDLNSAVRKIPPL